MLQRPDEKVLKAIQRLQGSSDLTIVVAWLAGELERTMHELSVKTDEIVLRQFQGRAQLLSSLLKILR